MCEECNEKTCQKREEKLVSDLISGFLFITRHYSYFCSTLLCCQELAKLAHLKRGEVENPMFIVLADSMKTLIIYYAILHLIT